MKSPLLLVCLSAACGVFTTPLNAATFGDDVQFVRRFTPTIVLSDPTGSAKIAVSPAWEGRVLTSTAAGDAGRSFGWINRELIESGKIVPHMNPYGGEDRIWLGPEGGQFSLYFAKGAAFDFANWFVPAPFDTQPFELVAHTPNSATFQSRFTLTNYSGAEFHVGIHREVRLLAASEAWMDLGLNPDSDLKVVAYESANTLKNEGSNAWRPDTGLLSIWILGMFAPAPSVTIVAPIQPGPDAELGRKVTADYFGQVPPDRLKVTDQAVFLKADGKYRSKIGLSPRRSRGFLGSYDADNQVLTLVQFDQPRGVTDYVNSLWKLQDHPYGGDVANAYNDGPPSPGAKPMGPFLEMESSSPAAALAPGQTIGHVHRTIHIIGPVPELDRVARAVLGLSLSNIQGAFAP